jgi:hypothetical protein
VIGSWNVFSASKLIQLYECPLAFYFRYFLHQEIIRTPAMVFGSALHQMFDQFFKKNFKSPKTFSNTWKNYWLGICSGKFGDHGRKSKPVLINFRDEAEKGSLLGFGINITRRFYEENLIYRKTPYHPQTEVSFHVPFRDYILRGSIDRIQKIQGIESEPDEIWDYKPRIPGLANLRNDVQLTIYDHAYRTLHKKVPHGLRIYGYKTGDFTDLVWPRKEKYFDELELWLKEAHAYIFGVLFWQHYNYLPNGFRLEDFGYFSRADVEKGVFSPRYFPNSNHCKLCSFYKDCEDRRDGSATKPMAEELLGKLAADRKAGLLSGGKKASAKAQALSKVEISLFPDEAATFEDLNSFVAEQVR